MNYRRVFINGNSAVASCCLLLAAVLTRFIAATTTEVEADKETLQLTTTTTIRPSWPVGQSCVNWTTAPEARDGNCTRMMRLGLIRCHGGMNNLEMISSKTGKLMPEQQMLLCGWSQGVFNHIKELQRFPQLRSLTIEYGDFTEISFLFPEMFHLQAINISWTNLSYISTRTFKKIHALKVLDLRWNQLVQLEGPLTLSSTFQQLYLAGNPWNCDLNFKWLLLQPEKSRLVMDRENLTCNDNRYGKLQMLLVLHYKVTLQSECELHKDLSNCTCQMHYINKNHVPLYTVNCSHLQFYNLPSYLPENTTNLYMNDNFISDVNLLRNNPHYRSVVDIELSNNRITNIDVLEDTEWLHNIRLFSLRGNLMRKFQVFALDNAFHDNTNVQLVLLSRNPYHCTCKFGMRLRELLTKYKDIAKDAWNVTCTYMHGDELRLGKVLSLTREDICNTSDEKEMLLHPIDMLNCTLASLILLILGKLGYDYYYYRHHGRVPWIVLKMP